MPDSQFFSHATAAVLWGAPVPYTALPTVSVGTALHVSALRPDSRPRLDGVIGHTLSAKRTRVVELDGLRLTDPATTWAQLSTLVKLDDLIAAGDFFVTGEEPRGEPYPRALSTLGELREARVRYGRTPGATLLREALPRVRFGPLSPRETLVRLRIVDAGLPEPELNWEVRDRFGRVVALIDLAYPEHLVGIEYEGDGHRERDRFRADIHRRERLEDLGWTIVRLTADDTSIDRDPQRVREMTNRIARRLRARGWAP
ncbi:endonuclease domain-containing protein [Agromyces atrinae]|uniref:endonuclease domain-containing protein n=1 Tax=Agromyces atrinae TaxID=592376 RepID=UPI001F581F57|nr:endonuclease domain-containing protein [Agromyces atrinae]MCI2957398.1 endonuclease domain-containing protein [Agromyces atrinae]